jgi:hypothetical protein
MLVVDSEGGRQCRYREVLSNGGFSVGFFVWGGRSVKLLTSLKHDVRHVHLCIWACGVTRSDLIQVLYRVMLYMN